MVFTPGVTVPTAERFTITLTGAATQNFNAGVFGLPSSSDIVTATATGTIPATALADLVVNSLVLGSTSLAAGGGTSVSYQVLNSGGGAAAASVSKVYQSTISAAGTLPATEADPTLAAGTSVTGNPTITLPGNLAAGTYDLGVIADANNQVTESNNTNQVFTPVQITVSATTNPTTEVTAAVAPSRFAANPSFYDTLVQQPNPNFTPAQVALSGRGAGAGLMLSVLRRRGFRPEPVRHAAGLTPACGRSESKNESASF